ncbi:MAG: sigma-70 family RNA polymerase sigma factor [Vicinamibacteria bacterium]|nr:sigma-70 family RNA polymerase sigma factor [Vicinamibacteria bacterium]
MTMAVAEMALVDCGRSSAEAGLVESCRLGDAQAFSRLVSLHEGMVFNLAARLLGDAEEARDVSQEVFLQVYRTLDRFQGRSSLRTWIYRIVVNQCHNRRRFWRRRHRGRSCALEDLTGTDEVRLSSSGSAAPSPLECCERHEKERLVRSALERLSFEHRVVLLLREIEELSCEEIARTLRLPRGTVKSRLARARECLRRELLPYPREGDGR